MKKNAWALPHRRYRILRSLSRSVMPSAITHWLGVRAITVAPEQIALREGLRAGVAVGSVMVLALHLGSPLMAWSAFAAFWTCLVDPGGLLRTRLQTMLIFCAAGTFLTGFVAMASGAGVTTAFAALGVCVFLCGLARVWGAIATQISVLAAIVAVVAVCYPQSPFGALQLAGLFVLGSIWAALICVLAWPVDPYAPQRQACAAVFREQARMMWRLLERTPPADRDIGKQHEAISAYRRDIRNRIEQTRTKVELLDAGPTRAALLPAVEVSDRIFAAIMGFEHAALSQPPSPLARRTIRLVAATLQRMMTEITRLEPRPDSLRRPIRLLQILGERNSDLYARGARMCAEALTDLQTAWKDAVSSAGGAKGTQDAPRAKPKKRRPLRVFVRHAARLSVGVLLAYAISLTLNLPYAYWAMMAVVVVTQPNVSTTLPRTIERVAGSIAGGLLAAVMGVLLPMWSILLLVFPLAAATIALRSVNYSLCVMFMTQLFVLVTDLVSTGHGWDVALARSVNNIIGSLVGLAACLLLWPERRPPSLMAQVADAVRANLRYAALATDVRKTDWARIEEARRDAGTVSTQAEIQCQQARLEGLRRSEQLAIYSEILFLLRKMAGAASVWWMEHADTPPETLQKRAALYTALAHKEATIGEGAADKTVVDLHGMRATRDLLRSLNLDTV